MTHYDRDLQGAALACWKVFTSHAAYCLSAAVGGRGVSESEGVYMIVRPSVCIASVRSVAD